MTLRNEDRFIDRRIVIRSQRQAIELSYGAEAQTLETVSLEPFEEDLREVQRDLGRLHRLRTIALSRFGDTLGRVLLPAEIRAPFEADFRGAQQSGRCVRLGILDLDAVFPDWPWEYVRLPALDFVALSPFVSLLRLQAGDESTEAAPLMLPAGESLRVLIVYADPPVPGGAPLAADAEVQGLEKLMRRFALGLNPQVLWPAARSGPCATRRNLTIELAQRPPHILIIMTHGDYDAQRREGLVYLEGENGAGADPVSASDLATLLNETDTPCLVLLDACWTANRGLKSGGRSVAAALTSPHRIVLGMQGLWPASVCVPFWNTFFTSLLAPSPVNDALFAARDHLYRIGPRTADWGRAALYRSAVQPPPPAIRTRSVARPAGVDAVVSAVDEWLRHHLPKAKDGPLDLGPLKKHLISRLTGVNGRNTIGSFRNLGSQVQYDPLWILLAAEEDEAPIETTPVWFTSLREVPRALGWHAPDRPGPWRVRLRAMAWPDVPELCSPIQQVTLPEELRARWPCQAGVRWEAVQDHHDSKPCVSGVIQVLSPDERATADAQVREPDEMRAGAGNDPASRLRAASCCLELGLSDDALRLARRVLELPCGEVVRLLTHRLIAQTYHNIARALQERPGLQNECVWAASLVRWHLRASYATSPCESLEPLL